jgi:hypothetical protein
MKLWTSRFFLMTGLTLLLFHNIVAHHHDDEHEKYIHHHDHDALEHVKIDHVFYTDHIFDNGLQAIVSGLVYKPEYNFVEFPLFLPAKPLILPDEPYPPGWITDQIILRGPPSNC